MSLTPPRQVFTAVTAAVFMAVFGLSAIFTYMMPKTYVGTARVSWPVLLAPSGSTQALAKQVELAQSEPVLTQVVDGLNLNQAWGKKIRVDGELKTLESVILLKRQLELSPVEAGTGLEIQVYDDDSGEAAKIANRVADAFCSSPGAPIGGVGATVGVRAEAVTRPVRPNIPLNLALAAIGGLVLGLVVGSGAGWLVSLLGQNGGKAVA